jgi:hypothetical protein
MERGHACVEAGLAALVLETSLVYFISRGFVTRHHTQLRGSLITAPPPATPRSNYPECLERMMLPGNGRPSLANDKMAATSELR